MLGAALKRRNVCRSAGQAIRSGSLPAPATGAPLNAPVLLLIHDNVKAALQLITQFLTAHYLMVDNKAIKYTRGIVDRHCLKLP